MPQVVVVTSPFVDEDNQLFYEASFNKQNRKLSIKIFSHRGVLKNKRTLKIEQDISDLFTAEEYLIGLNANHHKIFILDVRKHIKSMVAGELDSKNGMDEEMRKNNQKFSFFYYDRKEPLIFGVFNHKHVFYFRPNNIGQQSNIDKRINFRQIAHSSNSLDIGKIYSATESIKKLEVQYTRRLMKKPQSPKKRSAILVPIEQKQFHSNSQIKNQDKNSFYQTVAEIYLLIEQKRLMRKLEVTWRNDKVEVKKTNTEEVYDFCFRKGWDMLIKYTKNHNGSPKKQMSQFQQFLIVTKSKGQYESQIKLSGKHQIFCSDETLFIVDPEVKTIVGILNSQFIRPIVDCSSIPQYIDSSNTMLMISRPDQYHLQYMFYVFNTSSSQFDIKTLTTPFYQLDNFVEEQIYLKKNIQKFFTPNGYIHSHFKEKVLAYLHRLQMKEVSPPSSISQEKQISKSKINESSQQLDQKYIRDVQDSRKIAKQFLNKIVFKDTNMLNKLLFALCNHGLKELFQNKSYSIQKQTNQSNHLHDSIQNNDIGSSEYNQQNTQIVDQNLNVYRCNFDTWNEYFEEIIFQIASLLEELSPQNNNNAVNQKYEIKGVFSNLEATKSKLTLLSNVYNRLLTFVETSQANQDDQLEDNLRFYKQKIVVNLNKIHSLFIIYHLVSTCIFDGTRPSPKLFTDRINKAALLVLNSFSQKRKQNITHFSQLGTENHSQQRHSLRVGILQIHEYFNNAKQLSVTLYKSSFEPILRYFMSNLSSFQEVAYLYFVMTKELNAIVIQDQKNKINQQSLIAEVQPTQTLLYPYMSQDLVEFFNGVNSIEITSIQNKNEEKVKKERQQVQKLARLSLKLNVKSFTLYMIQLCTLFKLPFDLIELIDSIKIQPHINQSHYQRRQNHSESYQGLKISKSFVQNQIFIIHSVVQCALSCNEKEYSNTLRELLFYEARRILIIGELANQNSHSKDQYEVLGKNWRENVQMNSSQTQPNIPNGIKLKNYLLQRLIQTVLSLSNNQHIRQIEELKQECLTSEEDRKFLQQVIDKKTDQEFKKINDQNQKL